MSMIIVFILALAFLAAGISMVRRPGWTWYVTERWKSNSADGPSDLYIKLERISGVVLAITALCMMGLVIYSWVTPEEPYDPNAPLDIKVVVNGEEVSEGDSRLEIATDGDLETYEYDPNIATDGNLYGYDGGSEIATGGNLQ